MTSFLKKVSSFAWQNKNYYNKQARQLSEAYNLNIKSFVLDCTFDQTWLTKMTPFLERCHLVFSIFILRLIKENTGEEILLTICSQAKGDTFLGKMSPWLFDSLFLTGILHKTILKFYRKFILTKNKTWKPQP